MSRQRKPLLSLADIHAPVATNLQAYDLMEITGFRDDAHIPRVART